MLSLVNVSAVEHSPMRHGWLERIGKFFGMTATPEDKMIEAELAGFARRLEVCEAVATGGSQECSKVHQQN